MGAVDAAPTRVSHAGAASAIMQPMPIDAVGGIFLILASIILNAASGAGANRFSVLAVILATLGFYLIYNGYLGRPSYLAPYLPYV